MNIELFLVLPALVVLLAFGLWIFGVRRQFARAYRILENPQYEILSRSALPAQVSTEFHEQCEDFRALRFSEFIFYRKAFWREDHKESYSLIYLSPDKGTLAGCSFTEVPEEVNYSPIFEEPALSVFFETVFEDGTVVHTNACTLDTTSVEGDGLFIYWYAYPTSVNVLFSAHKTRLRSFVQDKRRTPKKFVWKEDYFEKEREIARRLSKSRKDRLGLWA